MFITIHIITKQCTYGALVGNYVDGNKQNARYTKHKDSLLPGLQGPATVSVQSPMNVGHTLSCHLWDNF
jgi:hypothetical protein